MSDRGFHALRDEMFALYAEGRHADALTLVERKTARFPERWGETAYWLVCLKTLTGDLGGALASLQETVARGYWWAEELLRGDPDLKALQGDARFEDLVTVCRQRHAEAQTLARPELLVLRPGADPPWPLLIALHAAGGTAKEFAQHWRAAAADGWLVGVPQSSLMTGPDRYNWGDRARAAQEINGHHQALVREHPVDLTRAVLAGMSQGGARAIEMALTGSLPVRGVLGVACAPRNLEEVRAAVSDAAGRQIRFYLVVGDKDHVFDQARQFVEILQSAGVGVRLEVRPGHGHAVPPVFERSLQAGLRFILG